MPWFFPSVGRLGGLRRHYRSILRFPGPADKSLPVLSSCQAGAHHWSNNGHMPPNFHLP
ncbi:hypothetical protein PCLA_21r0071 [Pseudomonas citronellolis]|nr:hypothetical protein PCLA_21r0071 [Pseudomonas citronellolis]